MIETTTIATEATIDQIATTSQQLANIEVLLTYILGVLVIIFIYGCFKFVSKFLDMFF